MDREAKQQDEQSDVAPDDLAQLGLGPDAPLLNDPKLFVDARFLASLLAELERELGPAGSGQALFQIGATHGLRDARRLLSGPAATDDERRDVVCTSPSLVMRMLPAPGSGGGLAFEGDWPETHEAEARLAGLGRADRPACRLSAGYTSGWLSEVHDLDIVAVETECTATGAPACRFRAAERATWLLETDRPAECPPALDRSMLERRAPAPFGETATTRDTAPVLDPADDAVHVWGPVMVLPFTRPDDALATVHLLGRDRTTVGVKVVVVDLRQHPLERDLGTELLAQTLEAIEAWGGEAVLTGICQLSAPLVADLESSRLLTCKDLPEAVATALQIAEAQRHPL